MSLFSSGDRVFEWSWTCCLLALLFAGCSSAPDTIMPPEYEDDFGSSYDAEPITAESVAESTMMHQRAQFDLAVDASIPLESKIDETVQIGAKFNYEIFKNLFMGVSFSYADHEINDGAGDDLNSDLDSLEAIQAFDSYEQWNFFGQFDYDIPITRPTSDLGAMTFRIGVAAGLTAILPDEDDFLKNQFNQAGSKFELQDEFAFVLRPAIQLRWRVWKHGLAFLGASYDWVPEDRVDVKFSGGQRRELNDDIQFDMINVGGGFSFEW